MSTELSSSKRPLIKFDGLHPQLAADCFLLGRVDSSYLLLHKNALLPWFILVPDTQHNELYKLPVNQQQSVQQEISQIAAFTEQHFHTDKLNIATIGNLVPQLHVHIIGRFVNDFCWPAPVWGQTSHASYKDSELNTIIQALQEKQLIHSD